MGLGEKILKFWEKSLCGPACGAVLNIGGNTFKRLWRIKKGLDPKFFCLLMKGFRPFFRPEKKKIWFMLIYGLNCNFDFYIVKNWSFWPDRFLWDVCWPNWPSLAKIRQAPSVRYGWRTTGLAVKCDMHTHTSIENGTFCHLWYETSYLKHEFTDTEHRAMILVFLI